MPKYVCRVTRTYIHGGWTNIDAPNEEEAIQKALDKIPDLELGIDDALPDQDTVEQIKEVM